LANDKFSIRENININLYIGRMFIIIRVCNVLADFSRARVLVVPPQCLFSFLILTSNQLRRKIINEAGV
jgi:hypothetical protein